MDAIQDRPSALPGSALPGTGPPSPPHAPVCTVPSLPGWLVPRPRLVARLSRAALGPLTVVVGPVGAGKTALLTEWARTAPSPGTVVWVACDGAEERREVFWPRVAARLREAGVEIPDVPDVPPDDGTWLSVARVADALVRHHAPVVIVLDDFQPEPGSPTAKDVTLLLRYASPRLRLVVAARRDPPLHLHRRRLAGELGELRISDLAFVEQETAALLAQHGVTLTDTAVRRLTRRTEGWAAGIRLAAMSMDGHPDPACFVARFAGDEDAVVSYLVEEVLDAQPPAMRRLLLVNSVLGRTNHELAAAVAGVEPDDRFAELVGQNSFLQPVGQGWYRCHSMFRDVLRLRLYHEAPGEVTLLHHRAAAWLGEHDLLPEALEHALAAHDPGLAARLAVERLGVGTLLGLSGDPLPDGLRRRLLHAVTQPADEAAEPERALVAAALTLAHGDAAGCAEALRRAGEPPDAPEGCDGPALAARLTGAVIRTEAQRTAGPEAARTAAAEAEELCARLPSAMREQRPELRASTLTVRGEAELRQGRLKSAERTLLKALEAAESSRGGPLYRDCLVNLALLEVLRGRMRSAAELAARVQGPQSPAPGFPDRSRAALRVVNAWVALVRGEVPRARQELTHADSAPCGPPDPLLGALRLLADEVAGRCEDGPLPLAGSVRGLCSGTGGGWPTEGLERAVRLACDASRTSARAPAGRARPSTAVPAGSTAGGAMTGGETLSGREPHVLEHLARTMTTEEIAAEMYLSVNTVKTHLKSLYRKLEVTRRSAAVRRARELELL